MFKRYIYKLYTCIHNSEYQLLCTVVIICLINGWVGATPWDGLTYAQAIGLVSEASYPYSASVTPCQNSVVKNMPRAYINTSCQCNFVTDKGSLMMAFVSMIAPLSISVDANTWKSYQSGIIRRHCPGGIIDHAVQIVGYSFDYDADGDCCSSNLC